MSLTSRLASLEQRLGTFTSEKEETRWEFNTFVFLLYELGKIVAVDYETLRLPQTDDISMSDKQKDRLRQIINLSLNDQADARLVRLWAQFAPQRPCPLAVAQ